MARAGVSSSSSSSALAAFVGNAGDASGGSTRSYSITHTCNSSVSYIILLGNGSTVGNYNKIDNCTVNGVSATLILQSGTATSYSTTLDRNSAAIFVVSGISGSSISISSEWTGSNVLRSSAQVYEANKILTLDDTAVDTGSASDNSGTVNVDVDANGFVIAFSSGVSANYTPTFNGDVSDDDTNVVSTYFTALCGYKEGGGAAYQIDGTNLTNGNANTSFRMLAASFV